ncbi:M24 family metallopeptidase [Alicyclobacillus shizuokensis]|uniref:M24 family metallopeptidase n=1 Tax=Alicyclobacillus shizuokensis TaxID=392014 RepID=UPI0009F8C490|nr:Xaa-Pro peptidase family protein [Alicyclobacillus shizuokensis]
MENRLADRRHRLYRLMQEQGVETAVVASVPSIYYLTGVWVEPGERVHALILRADGDPVWVAAEMFKQEIEGSGVEMHYFQDGDNPYERLAEVIGSGKNLVVDGEWPTRHLLGLASALRLERLPGNADLLLQRLRVIKDDQEIQALERASQMADAVVGKLAEQLRPGMSERAAAELLAGLWREAGALQMSFPPIIASGKQGAAPHHEPDDTPLARNSTVIVDTGGVYDHYCSDITRTFVLGRPSEEMERVYKVVWAAQQAGVQAAKPGRTLHDVDAAVREVIMEAGYGEYFTHRTGHGVGLDIHEAPYVMAGNTQVLEPGMVMSVEPGVYLPGKFGVRIEDLVVVEEGGARSLNRAAKTWESMCLDV